MEASCTSPILPRKGSHRPPSHPLSSGEGSDRDLPGILGCYVCLQLETGFLISLLFSFCTPAAKASLTQPTQNLFQDPLPCCPWSCFFPFCFYFSECENSLAKGFLFCHAQGLMFLSSKEHQEVNCSLSLSLELSQCHTNMELELLNSRPMLCLQAYPTCIQHQNFPEIPARWA